MYPVSDAYLAAVRTNNTAIVKAEIWDGATKLATLSVDEGKVTADRTRSIRRQADCALIDAEGTLTPTDARDLLAPYGNELHLYRGVRLDTGVDEYASLGVFRMVTTDIEESSDGVRLSITGWDRSCNVAANGWPRPYTVSAGTLVTDAVRAIVIDRYPALPLEFDPFTETINSATFDMGGSSNPWQDACNVALSAGLDLYIDGDGTGRLRAIPNPATSAAVFDYRESDVHISPITAMNRRMDTSDKRNGVILTAESTDLPDPILAEAWDDDPFSPTFRGGKFGPRPRYVASQFIPTAERGLATAQALLLNELGDAEQLNWSMHVNAAHDVYDVIAIRRDAMRVNGIYTLDSVGIPLSPSATMDAIGRGRLAAT